MSISFFNTHISSNSFESVKKVLDSTFLSEGEIVKEFEDGLSQKLGLVNPVAVNSCTSALHLALILAGVKENDEVILPAQTFIATGLVILMQKAKPVLAQYSIIQEIYVLTQFRIKLHLKLKLLLLFIGVDILVIWMKSIILPKSII